MPWQFEPQGGRTFRFRRYPFVHPEPSPSSEFSQTSLRPPRGWLIAVLRDLTSGTNDAKGMVLEEFLAHAVLAERSEFHSEVRKPPKGFTPSLPIHSPKPSFDSLRGDHLMAETVTRTTKNGEVPQPPLTHHFPMGLQAARSLEDSP